jgi:hypothetical protein
VARLPGPDGQLQMPAHVRRGLAALLLLIAVTLGVRALPDGGVVASSARPAEAVATATATGAGAAETWEPTVVIGPGETVWELAAPHAPAGTDLHLYVQEVLRHNGLDATAIAPGTVIRLPRR